MFRGVRDARWTLQTSLERNVTEAGFPLSDSWGGAHVRHEHWTIREFKTNAGKYIAPTPGEDLLEWVALMQHYGAPTRLLDLTHSFDVALFFAFWDLRRRDAAGESAIWAVHRRRLEQEVTGRYMAGLRKGRLPSGAMIRWDDQRTYNAAFNLGFQNRLAVAVEPKRKNVRLTAQQGLFLFPFNVTRSIHENLFGTVGLPQSVSSATSATPYSRVPDPSRLLSNTILMRIHIPHRLQAASARYLKSKGIDSATMFPNLVSYAQGITSRVRAGQADWSSVDLSQPL